MLGKTMDRIVRRPARYFYSNFMESGGIHNTMHLSKMYNRVRYRGRYHEHRRAFRDSFDALLLDNGYVDRNAKNNVMRDGWAIDTSHSLPHLDALLEETNALIDERGGKNDPKRAYPNKPFFHSLRNPDDAEKYPSFLNFVLSSEVLETVGRYMGTVPVLSKTMPRGMRFVESWKAYETEEDPPYRSSQLYHLDIHDIPLVYMRCCVT